jgi:hypothetical protein
MSTPSHLDLAAATFLGKLHDHVSSYAVSFIPHCFVILGFKSKGDIVKPLLYTSEGTTLKQMSN